MLDILHMKILIIECERNTIIRISIRERSLAKWSCFLFGSVEINVDVGQLMEEKKEAARLSNTIPMECEADANEPGLN